MTTLTPERIAGLVKRLQKDRLNLLEWDSERNKRIAVDIAEAADALSTPPPAEGVTDELAIRLAKALWPSNWQNETENAFDALVIALASKPIAGVDYEARIKELEKLVYVPGLLKCKKCGFGLIKTNLYVMDGTFGANNEPDYCPNDGSPMWRVTERDAANEYIDRTEKMVLELNELKAKPTPIAAPSADAIALGIAKLGHNGNAYFPPLSGTIAAPDEAELREILDAAYKEAKGWETNRNGTTENGKLYIRDDIALDAMSRVSRRVLAFGRALQERMK